MDNKFIKVLEYYNLLDVVESGDKFKIVCPFHADLNASLQINLDKDFYYCYGCEKKGDIRQFIKEMEKCNDIKATLKLKEILNTNKNSNFKIHRNKVQTSEELMFESKRYFFSLSKTNWYKYNNSYMHKRGFTSKVLNEIDARLNDNNDYGVVFPMRDNGKFKGYVCRATNKEMESKRKYLYSKGFTRRNTLVGYYKNAKYIIVVEGYMDWLKFRQYGIKNVVAILGWKITQEQIDKIKQYTNNVVSALDNTDTGRQGTEVLKKYFNVVRYQFQDFVKDPGDFTQLTFNYSWMNTKELIHKNFKGVIKNN